MIETMMEHVASVLRLPADEVRERNMYKKGDTTPIGQYLQNCNAKEVFDNLKVFIDPISPDQSGQ